MGRLGEICVELSDLAPSEIDLRRRRDFIGLQLDFGEIRDAIAEPVDMNDATLDHPSRFDQPWRRNFKPDVIINLLADFFGLHSKVDARGDRTENVTPVKCRAYRMAEVLIVRDVINARFCLPRINKAEDAVVRPYEVITAGFNDDRAPRRPHPGINHSDVNRSGRKIVVASAERESGRINILRRDVVRDVNYLCSGTDCEDYSLDGRNEIIRKAEIGEKGDHKTVGSREWGVGNGRQLSTAHSPLPIPYSPLPTNLWFAPAPRCESGFRSRARVPALFRPGRKPSRLRRSRRESRRWPRLYRRRQSLR